MHAGDPAEDTPPRTLLEELIRERQQSLEEFIADAEKFAREQRELGTISLRNLQRLVAGTPGREGTHAGTVRPSTARLLQKIFGVSIRELLSPPRRTPKIAQPMRVAIAIVARESKVLLVCRREDTNGLSWQFPAGLVKPGASPQTVAVRETLNETGVHCVVARTLGTRLHPITKVICDYILCDYVTGDARNMDVVENVDVIWAPASGITRLIPAERIYSPILRALQQYAST